MSAFLRDYSRCSVKRCKPWLFRSLGKSSSSRSLNMASVQQLSTRLLDTKGHFEAVRHFPTLFYVKCLPLSFDVMQKEINHFHCFFCHNVTTASTYCSNKTQHAEIRKNVLEFSWYTFGFDCLPASWYNVFFGQNTCYSRSCCR